MKKEINHNNHKKGDYLMDEKEYCKKLIEKYYKEDKYPLSLGIEITELLPGYCKAEMHITEEKTNFHGITHGGALFSLADTAFGLASNSREVPAVAIQVSINFMAPSVPGERLIAVASEENLTRSTGVYNITIKNDSGKAVALFRGTVFRKNR